MAEYKIDLEKSVKNLLDKIQERFGVSAERLVELAEADQAGRCFITPFVAMVEQSLSEGEMKPQRDQRFNGRYAVVYSDKEKWASPLIDICGKPYHREEAESRMNELAQRAAEAATKGEQHGE